MFISSLMRRSIISTHLLFSTLQCCFDVAQAHTKSITLLQTFKGAFIITGTSDGCVSIWTFELEEAFSTGVCLAPPYLAPRLLDFTETHTGSRSRAERQRAVCRAHQSTPQLLPHLLRCCIHPFGPSHTHCVQGKGAPQLWLVGSGGQIVCVHSPDLSSIILRADGGGQKPDVTSFFDGLISSLPIASMPSVAGAKDSAKKSGALRAGKAAHITLPHDLASTSAGALGLHNVAAAPSTATAHAQAAIPDTDLKRLKQVLDTINTTKTVSKITLSQQVGLARCSCRIHTPSCLISLQARVWRKAFDFFDENKASFVDAM